MKPRQNKLFLVLLPVLFGVLVSVGILIGMQLAKTGEGDSSLFQHYVDPSDKVNQVLKYVEREYVDSVNKDELVEQTIEEMLHNLDPHSHYIPASEFEEVAQQMEGNFEGIGIEFNVVRDTIRVVSVIAGGPSQKVGLQAGDQILKVNGENVAGVKIKNKDITGKLRGKKGTKVNITVKRFNRAKLLEFSITRDEIPLYSIDVSYMVKKDIGYIKLNRFAETSYEEFMQAAEKLLGQGMKKLIFDLRDNGGGLLDVAIRICDEFLADKQVIVYTMGRNRKKDFKYATNEGKLTETEVVILIDENSASASEIVAGAIQDNDRGIIVGRRSFGKGLVQRQTELSDGSALRLTTARYYTPTGRCIQKPYDDDYDAYRQEESDRFLNGELLNADSIRFPDSLKFKTPKGKVVYGGGGIMPDLFVPIDTLTRTDYLNELFFKGLINQFSFDHTDKYREQLERDGIEKFKIEFRVSEELLEELADFASKNDLKKDAGQLKRSAPLIRIYLKASIARNIWGADGFYPVYNTYDWVFLRALKLLDATER
ncbi:MAG: S41 family peptidase [Bacteroidia bacterium]|nr:S41 family peptidase [Bacteroidia bacterium]